MNVERALIDLAVAEHELARAALRFAAAHQDATNDEGMERMLAARDALFEAVDHVDAAETVRFETEEADDV